MYQGGWQRRVAAADAEDGTKIPRWRERCSSPQSYSAMPILEGESFREPPGLLTTFILARRRFLDPLDE